MTVSPSNERDRRPTVLFVAEGVTFAHVVRPMQLLASLDPARHRVVFDRDPRYAAATAGAPAAFEDIESLSPEAFRAALQDKRPVYDDARLERAVADDLALIERVRPDLIVGDFRLSLSVSARRARVRYAALTNAHWSSAWRGGIPHVFPGAAAWLGNRLVQTAFDVFRPLEFRRHAAPLNRVRGRFGLPALAHAVDAYADGDDVLYDDVPGLCPMAPLPPGHRFLGPVLWEPAGAPPPIAPSGAPIVYLTFGSSGAHDLIPGLLRAAAGAPFRLIVAAPGQKIEPRPAANIFAAPYWPGRACAAMADLVVGNGGSGILHQALSAGKPILGVVSNFDQSLSMVKAERAGAGEKRWASRETPASLVARIGRALERRDWREGARRASAHYADWDAARSFRSFVEAAFSGVQSSTSKR